MKRAEKRIYGIAMGALLMLALFVIGSTLQRQWAARRRGIPEIGGLTDALKRTAEKTLSSGALANEQIILTEPAESVEARAKSVVDAAIGAGGTAVKTTTPDGSATVLAQIPSLNRELFRGLIHREQGTGRPAARDGGKIMIEVLITPPKAAPSPSAAQP